MPDPAKRSPKRVHRTLALTNASTNGAGFYDERVVHPRKDVFAEELDRVAGRGASM